MGVEFAVEVSLRVALVSLLGCAVLRWVPGLSAAVRHRWSFGLLLASTILVPLAALLPRVDVPILAAVEVGAALDTVLPVPDGSWSMTAGTPTVGAAAVGLPRAAATPGSAAAPWWGWAWAVGTALLVMRSVYGQLAVHRLARRLPTIEAKAWTALIDRLRLRVGLRRPVRLMAMSGPISPAAFGILIPTVLLPQRAAGWRGEGLAQVLLHELAHLRRRDPLQRWVAEMCCAAFWFLPPVWMLERRMRHESERACDDAVLAMGTSASGYASVLLGLRQQLRVERTPLLPLACFVQGSAFEDRLRAILETDRPRGIDSGVAGAIGGVAIGLTFVAISTLRPVPALAPDAAPNAVAAMATGAGDQRVASDAPVSADSDREVTGIIGGAPKRRTLTAHVRLLTLHLPMPKAAPPSGLGAVPTLDVAVPLGEEAAVLPLGTAELWARERHQDHLRATYNFGFGTRDDRAATRNNWDLQLKGHRAPYQFDVTMAGSDRSRIVDMGPVPLESVEVPVSLFAECPDERVSVQAGHAYLIHTVDSRSDYWTRVLVIEVTDVGVCRLEWELLRDDTPPSVRRHP